MLKTLLLSTLLVLTTLVLRAQDNYEIQVYGSETVDSGHTMVELHSNYTFNGSTAIVDGQLPTNHVFHETIEITHGWTPWFETGFYIFNSLGNDGRTAYVGSHIRPRFAAPVEWKWPVGVSISFEFGFQKKEFSANTSTLEIRPIVDKKIGGWYFSVNPTLDQSFAGPDEHRGLIFSPNVKWSYDVSKVVALGMEYYGSVGPLLHYDPIEDEQHQIFGAIDLNTDPKWEFNAGLGIGLTNSTDKGIFKIIIGRRF
ncbi:MAG TPA: hypothetical protein VG367_06535 [Mucilaginibacter sp.]|jgi:hypothetical protein|nr:hypothetical protein [Mucilaginibacter sp.]